VLLAAADGESMVDYVASGGHSQGRPRFRCRRIFRHPQRFPPW